MTNSQQYQAEVLQDRYGLKLAGRLSAGTADLPHDISERLRVSRSQALAKRKLRRPVLAASVLSSGGAGVLSPGDDGITWWHRIGAALPLLVLAVGLVAINAIQNDRFAKEVAAVDAALLVDDLPPAAYADPGFVQYIKVVQGGAK